MSFNIGNIALGGISLNNSLQWTDRFEWSPVEQGTKRTLGGNLVVYEQGLSKGQPITLRATEETGWFTYGMVTSLRALAAAAGSSYLLTYHGESYTVKFDHARGATEFTPLIPKSTFANDTDYFIGVMRLFTV